MPRFDALARIALAAAAVAFGPLPAAGEEPQLCDGVPLLATPSELAATPRRHGELELLAISLGADGTPDFTADPALYERLVGDGLQIAAMLDIPALPYFHSHDGKTLRLVAEPATFTAIEAGTYTRWDCLNEAYGRVDLLLLPDTRSAVLTLEGNFDTTALTAQYATLPGIVFATSVAPIPAVPPPSTCVFQQDDLFHYLVRDPAHLLGACDAGCYFTAAPGSPPRFRGVLSRPAGQPPLPWAALASHCPYGPAASVRSTLDLRFDPPAPTVDDEVVLAIDGIVATCGAELEEVATDPGTGTLAVTVQALWGCLSPPSTFSIQAPLGSLGPGDHHVTVTVGTNFVDPPNAAFAAATWLRVRRAADVAASCPTGGPGATLLVPYFEVDVGGGSRTTLFSVGNAGAATERARVTLWTDRGAPTFGFTVTLPAGAVSTINLRDLFLLGRFPADGGVLSPPLPPVCSGQLPPADRLDLVARHTGAPSADGLCHGGPADEPGLATGYATVDVVDDALCRPGFYPGDPGYFAPSDVAFAASRNVLRGDVFYIDVGDDSAQGLPAITLPADPALAGSPETFYAGWVGGTGADQRVPLGKLHRARYLDGGGLGMTTDLLVWTEGDGDSSLATCAPAVAAPVRLLAVDRDEAGATGGALEVPFAERIARLRVGSDELPVAAPFGHLDLSVGAVCLDCDLEDPRSRRPLQSTVVPVFAAGGRFSVASGATRLDAVCP